MLSSGYSRSATECIRRLQGAFSNFKEVVMQPSAADELRERARQLRREARRLEEIADGLELDDTDDGDEDFDGDEDE